MAPVWTIKIAAGGSLLYYQKHLVASQHGVGALAQWNRPYGVEMTIGKRRYLRYVLRIVETGGERKE